MIPVSPPSAPHRPRHGLVLSLALLLGAAVALASGCGSDDPAPAAEGPTGRDGPVTDRLVFDLERPTARHMLATDLTELSGLAPLGDNRVAAVQDELGVIFVIDLGDGRILSRHRFGPDGDYEALAAHGDTLYALRSDGRLSAIPLPVLSSSGETDSAEALAPTRRLPLPGGCDAEGLAVESGRWFAACKEDVTNSDLPGIHAFDGAAGTRSERFLLGADSLRGLLEAGERDRNRLLRRLRSLFVGPMEGFRPSALAIEPGTGNLWVLSAVPPAVGVVSPTGRLLAARSLPRPMYPQPEALTFLPGGDLVIGSEGDGGPAPLYRFRRRSSLP